MGTHPSLQQPPWIQNGFLFPSLTNSGCFGVILNDVNDVNLGKLLSQEESMSRKKKCTRRKTYLTKVRFWMTWYVTLYHIRPLVMNIIILQLKLSLTYILDEVDMIKQATRLMRCHHVNKLSQNLDYKNVMSKHGLSPICSSVRQSWIFMSSWLLIFMPKWGRAAHGFFLNKFLSVYDWQPFCLPPCLSGSYCVFGIGIGHF